MVKRLACSFRVYSASVDSPDCSPWRRYFTHLTYLVLLVDLSCLVHLSCHSRTSRLPPYLALAHIPYLTFTSYASRVARYLSRADAEPELVQQLQIYEAVLRREDGESDGASMPADATIR